jgi:lipopolysaccharide transport system ATP-binding protein
MSYNAGLPRVQNPVIQVDNLGKMYTLYKQPLDRLKHTLLWRFGKDYGHPFWALKDVSFEIGKGETFGIIGRNGSGKSTLMQILSGILRETVGSVHVSGRVAPLLELGSGFNPEFTGRENIRLNGMILGLSKQAIESKADEIADFAEIGEFIDQPVKFYSSGMFVRLAFAVAASLEADILLIDEVLAVGDIFFRQKCYQRLSELRQRGATIILVSHAMNEVEQYCERALLLHEGKSVIIGSAIEAVKRYYLLQQASTNTTAVQRLKSSSAPEFEQESTLEITWPADEAFLDISNCPQISNGLADCTAVALTDDRGNPCQAFEQGQLASFFFEFVTNQDIEVPIGGAEIINEKGLIVHGKNSLLYGSPAPFYVAKGNHVRFRQDIRLDVHTGEYTFNVGFSTMSKKNYAQRSVLAHPELDAKICVLNILPGAGQLAVLPRHSTTPVQLTHFGVANLPGSCQIQIISSGSFTKDNASRT